jgi:hypothetical protein
MRAHAWKGGHVCYRGLTNGMTMWELASDVITGEFGKRNADWRNRIERTTTQVFYIADYEGQRQAVATAVYTDANDCAVVVRVYTR